MITEQQLHRVCHGLRNRWGVASIVKVAKVSKDTVGRIKKKGPVRVLLPSDLHCGSNVGLTPPSYQIPIITNPETAEHKRRNKWGLLQRECWRWFRETIMLLQPIHKAFVMGDCIDGDGHRSNGTELIVSDRKVQAAMAIECLRYIGALEYGFVYGTPYHTGQAEDFETDIARAFDAKIGSHEWEVVNGVTFDLKHKQGNTQNPATSLFNEIRDNREWVCNGEQPKADVLVRGHTHRLCVLEVEDCTGISVPALQGYGTKFGSRQCSRKVQFGLVAVDVWPDGVCERHVHVAKLSGHITKANSL
jgi:hypothetical protein